MTMQTIINEAQIYPGGTTRRIKIVLHSTTVPGSSHKYGYRMIYVVRGIRVVIYDNQQREGDRQQHGAKKSDYKFINLSHLLKDFDNAIKEETR